MSITYYFPSEEAAKQAILDFESIQHDAFKDAMTESGNPVVYAFNRYRVVVNYTLDAKDHYELYLYTSKYRWSMCKHYAF